MKKEELIEIVEKLKENRDLSDADFLALLTTDEEEVRQHLFECADNVRRENYGTDVYVRGLIEFSNYCKNNCYYCGIRKGNQKVMRYRLTEDEILECCKEGYALGFRTFVLQSGEDPYFTDERMISIVSNIRRNYPDCAITLSIGEKEHDSYQAFFDAGADRYLLRHETATKSHYESLHPEEMSFEHRLKCLQDLKEIGYQVGAGFMVGSPYQKTKYLINDIRFLQKLQPDMIGIGPFLTHGDTPFSNQPNGSLEYTLRMLSILRLCFPYVLLPATTALGTIHPLGREMGLACGANVVMPNLSPGRVRKLYELYDNKICTGEESAQCRGCLEKRVASKGYQIVTDRGDVKKS